MQSSRPRLRFSLHALFAFTTISCLALTWWVQPRQYVVESLFHIGSIRPSLLSDSEPTFDPREFDLLRTTHSNLIRSDFVIMAALRDPKIAALPIIRSQEDAVAWVRERLEVDTPGDSELLTIRMRCAENATGDVAQIVDALASAYVAQLVFGEDQRRSVERDTLLHSFSTLRAETADKMTKLKALENDEAQKVEGELLQIEVDANAEVLREMSRKLRVYDLNAVAPSRIRLIQKAISRPE